MNIQTLKKLIEIEFDRSSNISHFKHNVLRLIDLYDEDNNNKPFIPTPGFYIQDDMVLYSDICSCNPKNGGSGICGCTIGNRLTTKQ